MNNKKGFTLIELLAVITIMGILMMVAIPAVSRTIENSRRDTFADVTQNYLNVVRNAVLADEIKCAEDANHASTDFKTVNALGVGDYYFFLATDDAVAISNNTGLNAAIATQMKNQTNDLMESGGKSSWGNADVYGWIHWTKTASGSETKTVYKAILTDASKHGLKQEETDQEITRTKVSTSDAVANINTAISSIGSANVYYCEYK